MTIEPLKSNIYMQRYSEMMKDRKFPKKQWWRFFHNICHSQEPIICGVELEEIVSRQLKQRQLDILAHWVEYPELHAVILQVQEVFNIHWKHEVVFVPEDDYAVIGKIITGDLEEMEIIYDIEKKLGLSKVINDDVVQFNMINFIHYLSEMINKN